MKSRNPRSKAAMREAIEAWDSKRRFVFRRYVEPHMVEYYEEDPNRTLAIFDLTELCRERKAKKGKK